MTLSFFIKKEKKKESMSQNEIYLFKFNIFTFIVYLTQICYVNPNRTQARH